MRQGTKDLIFFYKCMFLIHHIMLKSQQEVTRGHLWPFENTSMQNKYISKLIRTQ